MSKPNIWANLHHPNPLIFCINGLETRKSMQFATASHWIINNQNFTAGFSSKKAVGSPQSQVPGLHLWCWYSWSKVCMYPSGHVVKGTIKGFRDNAWEKKKNTKLLSAKPFHKRTLNRKSFGNDWSYFSTVQQTGRREEVKIQNAMFASVILLMIQNRTLLAWLLTHTTGSPDQQQSNNRRRWGDCSIDAIDPNCEQSTPQRATAKSLSHRWLKSAFCPWCFSTWTTAKPSSEIASRP